MNIPITSAALRITFLHAETTTKQEGRSPMVMGGHFAFLRLYIFFHVGMLLVQYHFLYLTIDRRARHLLK
jgi:hypothetical protein